MRRWLWPLPEGEDDEVPTKGPRAFGAVRKYDVHVGVDLVAKPRTSVFSVLDGYVEAIVDFTGPEAGSPWWESTEAVIVRLVQSQVCVLYGEVCASRGLRAGALLRRGGFVGTVARARRRETLCLLLGLAPSAMLHLELWESPAAVRARYAGALARQPNDWPKDGVQPVGLLDPTLYLSSAEMVGEI